MNTTNESVQDYVEKISQNIIVPSLLEVICKTTGMGFAAIARVTPEQWVACGVRDEISFGLKVGGELKVDTTICHEIRQEGTEVVIDHVAKDEFYCTHATPLMYGFQSYISVPIKLGDNRFFGTLCAIDPSPAILNTPEIVMMFKTYASLISLHLKAADLLLPDKLREVQEETAAVIRKELRALQAGGVMQPLISDNGDGIAPRDKNYAHMLTQSSLRIKELMTRLNKIL